ncbi:stage V sporulation protein AE [Bacillus sp. AFS018417]|uniref:stage V sporulation protein AE n=1 Tax=Bacillus TaxID=1386 RepID=UPI000BF9FDEA|nr:MULTISPECIES: stage V sporulation protein AE [unclassified Bacillus (in: firmicutes)]MCP1124985.1 stage V sporulation protein AE [Bacillus sp. 3103sda1]PEZ02810.1 stage V sporulation protein AE [Bacillus sp. AFS018417]
MRRRVILVTDGDEYAQRTIELLTKEFGGRCISASQSNPTKLTGRKIVELIMQTPHDPVFVMFDDSGYIGEGSGEKALKYVATNKQIDVLGVLAVASNTHHWEWARVDVSIDREGRLTEYGVDKFGLADVEIGRINGDTVYCLDELHVPIIVGIGDIGKMYGNDDWKRGSPITKKAIQVILERSGFYDQQTKD